MNQTVIIYLGGEVISTANIVVENTVAMNGQFGFSFMIFTIPVCLGIILVNLSVIKILWKEERTIVNELMMLDSMVNLVYSSLATFQQSPYYRGLGLEAYCFPHLMLSFATLIFNRLLPVSIVVVR